MCRNDAEFENDIKHKDKCLFLNLIGLKFLLLSVRDCLIAIAKSDTLPMQLPNYKLTYPTFWER